MPKKVSAQVHVLQRLLSLGNEHPDSPGFTTDEVLKWPIFKQRKAPRNSIDHAIKRFVKLNIVFSPGKDATGSRLYRVKNLEWAISYIEGDKKKPWLSLTPTPPESTFIDYDKHRPHFDVQLTSEWSSRVQGVSTVNNGQRTCHTKAFTLTFNEKSLKGQFFIRPYWREEAKQRIGADFYEYLHGLEEKKKLNGDFCLPVDLKGKRFFIGGRPAQWSGSHYVNQLDIRASEGDKNIRMGLEGLVDQADFNVRVLDFQDAVLETLNKQSEVQTKLADNLQKIISFMDPKTEQTYQSPVEDGGDFAYQ